MLLGSVRVMASVCSSSVTSFFEVACFSLSGNLCFIFQSFRTFANVRVEEKKRSLSVASSDVFNHSKVPTHSIATLEIRLRRFAYSKFNTHIDCEESNFHGSCANSFTSARAASCDLFPECRTNRCDADDARARAGLPLSPYRLRWRHLPPDINRSNMRLYMPLHQVAGIFQHIIPLPVMKMLLECSKIRLGTK